MAGEENIRFPGSLFVPATFAKSTSLLKTGEIFSALVKYSREGSALLLAKGIKIPVKTEVPLSSGSRIALTVMGFDETGRVILKVLSGSQNTSGTAPDSLMKETLLKAGVHDMELGYRVLKEVREQGVKMGGNDLHLLLKNAGQVGVLPRQAGPLVWLWARGIPLSAETLKAAEALYETFTLRFNPERNFMLTDKTMKILGGSGRLSLQLKEAGNSLIFSQSEGTSAVAQKLASLFDNLGLGYERSIALLKPGTPEQMRSQIFEGKPALKPLLLWLFSRAEQKGEVNKGLERWVERLTGLQLLNVSGSRPEEQNIFLQGWIQFLQEEKPFWLKISQEKNHEAPEEEQNNLKIIIFLTTPNLGQVTANMRYYRNTMLCEITVEKATIKPVVDKLLPDLEARLRQIHPEASMLPCRVLDPGTLKAFWEREIGIPSIQEGLDIRI